MPTPADLGALVKQKYPQYAHMNDAAVGRLVATKYPSYRNFLAGGMAASHDMTGAGPAPAPWHEPALVAQLPNIGGIAGGIGGGVVGSGVPVAGTAIGAVGGSMLGGTIGQAGRQIVDTMLGHPQAASPGAAVGDALKAGVVQGLYEAGGQVGGRALGYGGKMAYKAAVGAAPEAVDFAQHGVKLAVDKLKSTFAPPEAIKTAIDYGIGVTRLGRDKLMNLLGRSGENEMAAAWRNARGPAPFVGQADHIALPMIDAAEKAFGRPLQPGERQVLADKAQGIVEEILAEKAHGLPRSGAALTAPELVQVRQGADRFANRAAERTGAPTAHAPDDYKAVAAGARNLLRQIPDVSQHTEVSAQLARLKGLLWPQVEKGSKGMAAAMGQYALRRTPGAALGAVAGAASPGGGYLQRGEHAAIGAALGGALGTPANMSRMALIAAHPAMPFALSILARGLGQGMGTAAAEPSPQQVWPGVAAKSRALSHVPATMTPSR